MVGWIILGVIVVLVIVLLCLRVGVTIRFGDELHVTAHIGPQSIQIIPPPEKKQAKKQKAKPPSAKAAKPKEKEKLDLHLTFDDVRGALSAAWRAIQGALRRAGKRIRINPMELNFVFGDENPVNTAQWYGWVNIAIWTVMPRLEERVCMPDPHIHMEMDFDAMETKVSGTVGLSYRVADLLAIGFAAAGPLLRFGIPFLKRQRAIQRAAARQTAQEAAEAKKNTEDTPEKAA